MADIGFEFTSFDSHCSNHISLTHDKWSKNAQWWRKRDRAAIAPQLPGTGSSWGAPPQLVFSRAGLGYRVSEEQGPHFLCKAERPVLEKQRPSRDQTEGAPTGQQLSPNYTRMTTCCLPPFTKVSKEHVCPPPPPSQLTFQSSPLPPPQSFRKAA